MTQPSTGNFWECPAHSALKKQSEGVPHLRELLQDTARCDRLYFDIDSDGSSFTADFSRCRVTKPIMEDLFKFAEVRSLKKKIDAMFAGEKINETEKRAVLHTALRCDPKDKFQVDGKDVTKDVLDVLTRIDKFSSEVRSGSRLGHTGKKLTDVICIGIGGSYLGPEFVYEALSTDPKSKSAASGRRLRFLANVDPIDVERATAGLTPETTLVIIISKTFTTAETMLNARTIREWLVPKGASDDSEKSVIKNNVVAVSTNVAAAEAFGIDRNNVFGFWDWVGGRFSVCSAVGCVPLALHYGFPIVREFLNGCRWMDQHFKNSPVEKNVPVLMGLISFYNSTYLGMTSVAVLPYCQALLRFASHVQQLTMESNGKSVTIDGRAFPEGVNTGETFFGEPGTNGQHSFYQLLHQGKNVIPSEFIGFAKSQNPKVVAGEPVSNHEELMSNFFAQPDALALGKTPEQLKKENVAANLISHKTFQGNRPSMSFLFPVCNPFYVGALLALYEHRTAVEGFMWGLNSFDQWGVELGKVLAKNIREVFAAQKRKGGGGALPKESVNALPHSTQKLLQKFVKTQE